MIFILKGSKNNSLLPFSIIKICKEFQEVYKYEKMLLIPKGQYGYNTDYLKMVNYLSKHNVHVDILCFDNNRLRVNLPENVNVKYINISKIE